MIRLTHCNRPDNAGRYFRVHLAAGDSQLRPTELPYLLRARWIGPALPTVGIGLFDSPEASHLVRLSRGLHPSKKVRLAPAINRKRAYYDLTVTAPKSVSLGAVLRPDHPTAKAIQKAHLLAVEKLAAVAGRMLAPQKPNAPKIAQWLGVIFTHTHTSEGDPHLHSHIVFPNLGLNTEKQWRAIQVVIKGTGRLKLALHYGHELAIQLRQAGLGDEVVMRTKNCTPEIRSLRPLAPHYSLARRSILQASKLEEEKHPPGKPPAQAPFPTSLPRYDDEKLNRRRRQADRDRKPKPKPADDPASLANEAARWVMRLSDQEVKSLFRVLDTVEAAKKVEGRMVNVPVNLPPTAAKIIVEAYQHLPTDVQIARSHEIFRGAIYLSAGRHPWRDLRRATQDAIAEGKRRWKMICDEVNEQSWQQEHARLHPERPAVPKPQIPAALQEMDAWPDASWSSVDPSAGVPVEVERVPVDGPRVEPEHQVPSEAAQEPAADVEAVPADVDLEEGKETAATTSQVKRRKRR